MTHSQQPKITQENKNGSNIGIQHIHQTVSSENITPSVEGVMELVRVRKFLVAKQHVTALEAIASKDVEITKLLPLLGVLIDLASGSQDIGGLRTISQAKNSIHDPTLIDVVISATLRAELLITDIKSAEDIYNDIDYPGEFTQEVFYELIANNEQLVSRLADRSIQSNEIALCALARGLLYRGTPEQACQAAKLLVDRFPCFNNRLIHLLCQFQLFIEDNHQIQYWLLKGSKYKQFILITTEAIALMEDCRGDDVRVISIMSKLLLFSKTEHAHLSRVCSKYIQVFEEVSPEVFKYLSYGSGLEDKDATFHREESIDLIIEKLDGGLGLSLLEFVSFLHHDNTAALSAWYVKGGAILSESDIGTEFNSIHLLVFLGDEGVIVEDKIRTQLEVFSTSFSDRLIEIPEFQLNHVVTELMRREMHSQAYLLLTKLIDPTDIWLSPIVRNYIDVLLRTHKQHTLGKIFSNIPKDEWDGFLWMCHSVHLRSLSNGPGAIESINRSLVLNPESKLAWHHRISLQYIEPVDSDTYASLLASIPDSIFEAPSELVEPIVGELLNKGCFSRAEAILVRWFVVNPDNVSRALTNIHFSNLGEEGSQKNDPAIKVEGCRGGFQYTHGRADCLKLVVAGNETGHSCLVGEDSPLGKKLLSMEIGSSDKFGYKSLKLLEVLPPFVACFRIALAIRDERNDGSDCFLQLELPESKEDYLPFFQDLIMSLEDDRQDNTAAILKNPDFPLFAKGKLLGDSCPVHAALIHLTSPEVVKLPLSEIGIDEPILILLDIYSIVYLGISGLIHGLIISKTPIAITAETRVYLTSFMKSINSPSYMRTGINGGRLSTTTSEGILAQTVDLRTAIQYVLNDATVPSPEVVDIPEEVAFTEKVVDVSVYSTLRLSISNNIPWLCIDSMFAHLLNAAGYPVVHNQKFLVGLGEKISLKQKFYGLIGNGTFGLPFPTTFKEFYELSNSDLPGSHAALAGILLTHEKLNLEAGQSLKLLSDLATNTLIRGISKGEFIHGLRGDNPSNDGSAERVFNICCALSMKIRPNMQLDNLALFFLHISSQEPRNKEFMNFASRLALSFMHGNFIPIEKVGELIDAKKKALANPIM